MFAADSSDNTLKVVIVLTGGHRAFFRFDSLRIFVYASD